MTGYADGARTTTERTHPMAEESNREPLEDDEDKPGAAGGTGGDADTIPGAPSDNDDTEAGDTDQHSSADA